MKLSAIEKKLLRQQAEAYAFIHDLRQSARLMGTGWVLRRTEGIDETIAKRREEYPHAFQRFFNEALKRAQEKVEEVPGAKIKTKVTDGQGRPVPRREKRPPKKKEKEKVSPETHKRDVLE